MTKQVCKYCDKQLVQWGDFGVCNNCKKISFYGDGDREKILEYSQNRLREIRQWQIENKDKLDKSEEIRLFCEKFNAIYLELNPHLKNELTWPDDRLREMLYYLLELDVEYREGFEYV